VNIQWLEIEPGYMVEYIDDYWSKDEADELLRGLLEVQMSPEKVKMLGKVHVTRRLSAQYGRPYDYNELAKQPEVWTPLMQGIKARMETVAGPLHGGLVQVYPTGTVPLGYHHDHGQPEVIASLSLGAERDFRFGLVEKGKGCREVFRIRLKHGSLLIIPQAVNIRFKHEVPIMKTVKQARVNVTLRRFPR
jgi:alkylated DNA repair dioxygenase AlkB